MRAANPFMEITMNRFSSRFFRITPFLATLACGSVSSTTDRPGTLATVSGSVSNPDAIAVNGGSFRVAVIWISAGQRVEGGGYAKDHRVAQDVPVSPVFPASFKIDITEPPTDLMTGAEMFGGDPNTSVRGAGGALVAYEDLNGNGKLDLVTNASGAFVDRVLGSSWEILTYFEAKDASELARLHARDDQGNLPSLGFNLWKLTCKDGSTPRWDQPCSQTTQWLPPTAPIDITLATSLQLSRLMCEEYAGDSTLDTGSNHLPGETPAQFPPAADPQVTCLDQGRSYTYKTCTTPVPAGLCDSIKTTCVADRYTAAVGAPLPSGWPCAATP